MSNKSFTGQSLLDRRKPASQRQLPIDINTNIMYTSMDVGELYSRVVFSNEEGQNGFKTVWHPKPDGERAFGSDTPEQAYRKVYDNRINWFVDVLIAMGLESQVAQMDVSGINEWDMDSYLRFSKDVKALLDEAGTEPRVNLKVRYDNKGEWPFIPDYKFIEKHVPGNPPTLAYTDNEIEKYLKPASVDVEGDTVVNEQELY
jgi:hypothetical protein